MGVPCLHRHCVKASGPAGPAGASGKHLPRLRIKCVLFLGEGKRGQWSMANIWELLCQGLPGQEGIDGEAVMLASSG